MGPAVPDLDDDESGSEATTCPQCGEVASRHARFCSQCGAALAGEVRRHTVSGGPASGSIAQIASDDGGTPQRRRVTVLFADLSGFTAMTERFEPEDVRSVVNEFLRLTRAAVERWGGRVDQFLGDGVLAVFGDPLAREDDADRAVLAALDIREATHRLATPGGGAAPPLTAHIGVATGMAVTADGSDQLGVTAPMGTAVNLAARLQSLAQADEILVCETTAELVDRLVTTSEAFDRAVKGIADNVAVRRIGERRRVEPAARRLSALAGRDAELESLRRCIDELVGTGQGDVIVVVGEAGAGKSRLVAEAARDATDRHGPVPIWLEGRGRSLAVARPFAPIVEIIGALAGVDEHDDIDRIRRRLAELVDDLDLRATDTLGTLNRLFALDDPDEANRDRESYQDRLRRAVDGLLAATATRSPTVVCLQDLHWIDPSTIGLVRSIVPHLRSQLLFVFNSRPIDLTAVFDHWTEIRLAELDAGDIATMIESRLDGPVEPSLAALVAMRSGGNAFFAEEVLNRLVDDDRLEQTRDGWVLRAGARADDVPSTVQGVIASRLDALPSDARRQLRHAAVFGRDFTIDDLRGLDAGVDPTPVLDTLVRADLIRRVAEGDRPDGLVRYEFKHALTQDVAYASLTKRDRQDLHRSAAQSIETRSGDRAIELADVLGTHYQRAGDVEPAVHHLSVAAEQALDRYAIDEADQLYRVAYEMLVATADDAERNRHLGPLLVRWVLVHYYRGTWRNATDLLATHHGEVEASADDRVRGMALAWRGFSAAIARASIAEALDLLDRAVEIGRRTDDAVVLAHAHTWRIWARFLGGDHVGALADGARVDELLDRLVDRRYVSIKSAGAVGLAQIGLGQFADARRTARWLIETGAATGSTRAGSMGYSVLCLDAIVTVDLDGGVEYGRLAVSTATDPIYRDMARLMAVHAMVAAGASTEARSLHADLLESCTTLGLDGLVLAAASGHGVLRVLDGDLTGGMRELEDAIADAEQAGSEFLAALGRVYRACVRARSVTREVSVPLTAVMRNPRFVTRQVLPARRHSVEELEQLIADLPHRGGSGLRWLASLELAKVLTHRGDDAGARTVLDRARAWMPDVAEPVS